MIYDIVQNVSTLTTTPISDIDKVIKLMKYSIGDIISCSNTEYGKIVCNIGFGNLCIDWDRDDVRFKFTPDGEFEGAIMNGLSGNSNLKTLLEESLTKKILKTYKDLL